MKQNRVQRQAASAVVRAPINSYLIRYFGIARCENYIHWQIGQDVTPEMMKPDLPPDPDAALIEWIKSLNVEPDDVARMPTLAEKETFYTDDTKLTTRPLEPVLR